MHTYSVWLALRPERCESPGVLRAIYTLFSTLQAAGYSLRTPDDGPGAEGYRVAFAVPGPLVLDAYVLPLLERLKLTDCAEVGYLAEDEDGHRTLHITYPHLPRRHEAARASAGASAGRTGMPD